MSDTSRPTIGKPSAARLVLGFAAGFIAVLVFHQGMVATMHAFDLIRAGPYQMGPTWPFGLAKFWSLAFWGGVWGILFVLVEPWFPRGAKYWLAAFLFGAVLPPLVGWFIIAPIRGLPIAGGFHLANMWRSPIINGAWSLGTAVTLWLFSKLEAPKKD